MSAPEPITHFVFVDFENVQRVNLDLVGGKPVQVVLVVGKGQNRVDFSLTESLVRHSQQVRLVKAGTSGRNALDFIRSTELGLQCASTPRAEFHIISGDKGFDAVVEHLKGRGCQVSRHASFADVPVLTPPAPEKPAARPATAPAPRKTARKAQAAPAAKKEPTIPAGNTPKALAEAVRRWLVAHPGNLPKRRKTLAALIESTFPRGFTEPQREAAIDRLCQRGLATISDKGAITWSL